MGKIEGRIIFGMLVGLGLFVIIGSTIKLSTPETVELPQCNTSTEHNCYGTNEAEDGYTQNYVDIDGNTYFWEAK